MVGEWTNQRRVCLHWRLIPVVIRRPVYASCQTGHTGWVTAFLADYWEFHISGLVLHRLS